MPALLVLTAAGFGGFVVLIPVAPLWAIQGGATEAGSGWVNGILLLVTVMTQPFVPRLLARLGTGRVLAAGLALAAAGRRSDVGSWFLEHALPVGVWLNYVPKYWYVSATMGYYAIAPLFFFAIKRSRFPWASTAFLLAVTVLLVSVVSHMDNVTKVLGRLPALVLGLAVGAADQEECREGAPKWGTGLAALAFAALLSIAALYGLYRRGLAAYGGEMGSRLLLDLVAPPLCVLLAYLAEILERMPLRVVNRGLAHLGKYSLEIYLGHILIRDLLHRELHFRPVVVLLAMLALSYPAARAIHWTAERLLALWDRAMARLRRPDAA